MKHTRAELKMKKVILDGEVYDVTTYACEMLKYDAEHDSIYLVLKEGEIANISLDGIYECTIYDGQEGLKCEGKVCERYCNQEGEILCFQVQKGFYKININCVDKEEA